MKRLYILVACEESQTVCYEFRKLGHIAYSCDIQKCSGGHPEWHIHADVTNIINGHCAFITQDGNDCYIDKWDLVIAHPPCTYLSKAGARWLYQNGSINTERLQRLNDGVKFFHLFINAQCEHIAIENPTPLKVCSLPPYSQVIQPYMFGDPYSKRTLLWLKGLPCLKATNVLDKYTPFLPSNTSKHKKGKGGSYGVTGHTSTERSKTFKGVAAAMAQQWSAYLTD